MQRRSLIRPEQKPKHASDFLHWRLSGDRPVLPRWRRLAVCCAAADLGRMMLLTIAARPAWRLLR